jgi:hypothetical protein
MERCSSHASTCGNMGSRCKISAEQFWTFATVSANKRHSNGAMIPLGQSTEPRRPFFLQCADLQGLSINGNVAVVVHGSKSRISCNFKHGISQLNGDASLAVAKVTKAQYSCGIGTIRGKSYPLGPHRPADPPERFKRRPGDRNPNSGAHLDTVRRDCPTIPDVFCS